MIKTENLCQAEMALLKQSEDMPLQQVIRIYLQRDLTEDRMEDACRAAELIVESARIYTENRDNALNSGVIEDNKDIIRSRMETMDAEEAEDYVTKLNVLLGSRGEGSLAAEEVQKEYRNLRDSVSDLEPQERIDRLMEMLDLSGLDRCCISWETPNEIVAATAAEFAARDAGDRDVCLTWQQAAVRGAVLYKELMDQAPVNADAAALVTGQAAKLSDEASVSARNQAGVLSDEEARTILGAVGNGWAFLFFLLLWVLLFALCFYIPYPLVELIGSEGLALAVYFTVAFAGVCVLFDQSLNLHALVLDCVLNLKRLWNKSVGDVVPALKISNGGPVYWS